MIQCVWSEHVKFLLFASVAKVKNIQLERKFHTTYRHWDSQVIKLGTGQPVSAGSDSPQPVQSSNGCYFDRGGWSLLFASIFVGFILAIGLVRVMQGENFIRLRSECTIKQEPEVDLSPKLMRVYQEFLYLLSIIKRIYIKASDLSFTSMFLITRVREVFYKLE